MTRILPGLAAFALALAANVCTAYEVPILDTDYSRQICSGMWASDSTYINVTFEDNSQGQVAMVIYEWKDVEYLGKATGPQDDYLPFVQKTYVCTSKALSSGYCSSEDLGKFILDLPSSKSINETSFWSSRVRLPQTAEESDNTPEDASTTTTATPEGKDESNGFWNNPDGPTPTPPTSEFDTPWRRVASSIAERENPNPSPGDILAYQEPIQYLVRQTGYYCVAIVPVTVQNSRRGDTDVPYHPSYRGTVFFQNTFSGKLASSDYPKVNFYMAMSIVYLVLAAVWGFFCYRHLQDLLPIQYYMSGLVGLLVIEMVANWGYYRYLNAHGKGAAATAFLIVVAILDAGRNSMSFFMLLVVALGLSVVRESLDRTMLKCQALAVAHFIFGVLYAVGIVELELESTSALVLLIFVIPLAFTLSGFLLWIMYALNATIAQLKARKQRYKLSMFEKLNYILLAVVLVIVIFFVVSSFSFSGRLAEDYAAKTWRNRWWLLDGWLALLYLVSFGAIAYVWRPSDNNRRLAMSDEIAQDEEDAEDYDLEALESRTNARDDDEATLVGRRDRDGHVRLDEDNVVFEIGDEDAGSDDDEPAKKANAARLSGELEEGERRGLMGRNRDD